MSTPSEVELRSLVGLLDDEDPRSLKLVRERILGLGETVIPFLEEAHDRLGPRLRSRLDTMLFEVRFQTLTSAFRRLAAQPNPDLEDGAFLIARFARPTLDDTRYRLWLDETARAVSAAPPAPPASYPVLHRLNVLLFQDLAFSGNEARYYDPANTFLDQVIDTRKGIPISLSVLFLLLARRLGLPVQGAGLPGHYMVRYQPGRQPFFVDPFHKGRILTKNQCRQFLLRSGYTFREDFLQPTSSRETLARMLRNLISIYQKSGASSKAEQASTLVEALLTRGAPPAALPGGDAI